jgi:hypothetical protein
MEWTTDGVIRLSPRDGLAVDDAALARLHARLGGARARSALARARHELAARAARRTRSPADLFRIVRLAGLLALPELALAARACLAQPGHAALEDRLSRLLRLSVARPACRSRPDR